MEEKITNQTIYEEFYDILKDSFYPNKEFIEFPIMEAIKIENEIGDVLIEDLNRISLCLKQAWISTNSNEIPEFRLIGHKGLDFPDYYDKPIGKIDKKDKGKFWQFDGIVIRTTQRMDKIVSQKWNCNKCGKPFDIPVVDELTFPTRCWAGCGAQSGFSHISDVSRDLRILTVEEFISDYTQKKAIPNSIVVELYDSLTKVKINPGDRVRFTGIIKTKSVTKKSAITNYYVECNNIVTKDENLFNMVIPESYIEQFKALQTDGLIRKLSESLFHNIEGQNIVKDVLLISRARGVKTYNKDGSIDQRDTINVFLIGDSGCAKSDMARRAISADKGSMMVSGKGLSGVGLTATTSFDKVLGTWNIMPGLIPRCNHRSAVIDEIDKIDDNDTAALNEAMQNLSFTIAKADKQITLAGDVNIIGCANPDGRKWDECIDRYRQITLKPDFLDRFDIWMAVEKIHKESDRKKVIGKIVQRFGKQEENKEVYSLEFIQYYLSWCIQSFKPTIPKEIEEYITNKINELMIKNKQKDISYRLVSNIVRFAIAIAKLQQQHIVQKKDIDSAINYQMIGFKSLGMVDEFGNVSVEAINLEIPTEEKRKKYVLMDLINLLFDEKNRSITYKEIEDEAKRHVLDENLDDNISKLKQKGDLIETRNGEFRPMR
jgi:DNA replicative helicase MCM subunit Mcm2 (Cdc46/Mcm family)